MKNVHGKAEGWEGGVWCLTFELTPTVEAGAVSPGCDDAGRPQAGLTAPAVAGRGVERGVRPHLRLAELLGLEMSGD